MDTFQAIKILQALADGVDPLTNEAFPEDSPYQHPNVVRALFLAIREMEREKSAASAEVKKQCDPDLPDNAGKPWSPAEDDLLCRRFDRGMSTSQIALEHQRTRGSIKSRLVKLGKIEVRPVADEMAPVNQTTHVQQDSQPAAEPQ